MRLIEQLEASCTSVALNISEGKGRFSKSEAVEMNKMLSGLINSIK